MKPRFDAPPTSNPRNTTIITVQVNMNFLYSVFPTIQPRRAKILSGIISRIKGKVKKKKGSPLVTQ